MNDPWISLGGSYLSSKLGTDWLLPPIPIIDAAASSAVDRCGVFIGVVWFTFVSETVEFFRSGGEKFFQRGRGH